MDNNNYEPNNMESHSYHNLGGFLAFIVYGGIIGSLLSSVITIIQLFNAINILSSYSSYFNASSSNVILLLYLLIIIVVVYTTIYIKFLLKIKKKEQDFLFFFHKIVISSLIIIFIVGCLSGELGTILVYMLSYAVACFLCTLYFVKSVRVRTYMGSDEYIRIDPFTRNLTAPEPTDKWDNVNFDEINKVNIYDKINEGGQSAKSDSFFYNNQGKTKECTWCGQMLLDDMQFCNKCGKKYEVRSYTLAENQSGIQKEKICRYCGAKIPGEALFCGKCGKKQ